MQNRNGPTQKRYIWSTFNAVYVNLFDFFLFIKEVEAKEEEECDNLLDFVNHLDYD